MDMKKQRTLEDQLFWLGLAMALLGGVLAWIYLYLIPGEWKQNYCVWERLFGFYCPGCGGTRAVISLIQGHPLVSLWYHPLVLYTAVVFGSFMATQAFARLTGGRFTRGLKFHNWYLFAAVIIVAVNWIGKNVLRAVWNITL